MGATTNRLSGQAALPRDFSAELRNPFVWWKTGILLLAVGVLFGPTLARLVSDWWNDPNFSHGFFVPLFSAFVVWQDRKRLQTLPVSPSWFGLVALALSLGTFTVGTLGAELFLSRASFVLLLAGLIIHFLGWRWFRAVLFPWLFLFLMIPIPVIVFNHVAFPLQLLASKLATFSLDLSGVPVLREGNLIHLPTIVLEVVDACSGIRSLVSLVTLAIIYVYFLEPARGRRILLVLAAVPIAVVANALRVTGTGLLGYYWDADKAQGFFHTSSGLIIFVISLGLLFSLHGAMRLISRLQAKRRTP